MIHKPISKLSKGYRQRVGMAQALLHEPDVLILDEPTVGLDPNQIREVRRTMERLRDMKKTILLSTHILQEVEAMASRVILIDEGRLKYDGAVKDLDPDRHGLDAAFAVDQASGRAQASSTGSSYRHPGRGHSRFADADVEPFQERITTR